jgi:hypothetical protein
LEAAVAVVAVVVAVAVAVVVEEGSEGAFVLEKLRTRR